MTILIFLPPEVECQKWLSEEDKTGDPFVSIFQGFRGEDSA
jgi:hypothetical protein